MKKLLPLAITGGILVAAGVIYFTGQVASQYLSERGTKAKTEKQADHHSDHSKATCQGERTEHTVTIQNNLMHPAQVQASLCDTLTITNADDQVRKIAFGKHTNHTSAEHEIAKGQSFTTELGQTGTFTFHDHLQYRVKGEVVVTHPHD